jgi:RNA polymerase sigma-70 factor (ECF subfamily)
MRYARFAVQSESAGGKPARGRTAADAAMERYAAGDDAAFGLVYDALAPRLLSYLVRKTRNPEDAADLLQQTMLHVHRGRGDFIAGAEVTPWAFAIARRLLIDRARQRGPDMRGSPSGLETLVAETPHADDVVQAHELNDRVQSALSQLSPAQRAAFELVKQEGMTLIEAARVLGTSVGAAKLRMHRAYEVLRAALSGGGPSVRRGVR